MPRCLIALGANLGDRKATLSEALKRLDATQGMSIVSRSTWLETRPIGGPGGQPPFLNGAAILETSLDPESLARRLQQIETDLGRRRLVRWDARAIDLDVLLYADVVIETPQLVVPHPRMAVRRFVLEPAKEIAGDWIHPTIGWTIEQLWRHLTSATPYLAITGLPGSGKTQLAEALAGQLPVRLIADSPPPGGAPGSLPAGDSPSPTVAREIEFLVRRLKLLARKTWRQPELWAASDFWFDQSLAYSAVDLDPAGQAAVSQAWRDALGEIVPPKLLVVLEPAEKSAAGQRQRLGDELDRLARRTGIGPMLWLPAEDWETTVRETAAALAAMQ